MKKRYTLLAIFLSLGLLFSFTGKTYAATIVNESYTLAQDEKLEDDLYVAGEEVIINGLIDGDAFISAQAVKINGTITGNLFIATQTLDIDGNIHGNAYTMSQYANISGILSKGLFNMSQSITMDGEIGEDMLSMSAMASIEGNIDDDLRLMAGQTDISGEVAGDAFVSAGTVIIDETKISGEYYDDTRLAEEFPPKVNIDEDVNIDIDVNNAKRIFTGFNLTKSLIGFLGMYIVGAAFIALMPVKTYSIKQKITGSTSDFFYSLLTGFGIFILIPLPLIFLMVTLIGFPIAIITMGVLIFISIFGKLWVEIAFGEELLELFGNEKNNAYVSLLAGRGLSILINFVPVLRFFYNSILNFVALGAIVRMKADKIKDAKKKPIKRKAKKATTKKLTTKKK